MRANSIKIYSPGPPASLIQKRNGVSGSVHFNLAAMFPKWSNVAEHIEQMRVAKVKLRFTPLFSRGGAFTESGALLADQRVYFAYNKLSETSEPDVREDVVCFPKVFSKTARQSFTWTLKPHMRQNTTVTTVADNGAENTISVPTSIPFRYINPNDDAVSGINPIHGAQFYMDGLPPLPESYGDWGDGVPIWNITATAEIHGKGLNYIAPPGSIQKFTANVPLVEIKYKDVN
ncbi:putative capsid protein [Pacific flying fox faeces associated circular DNA virus-8]|nr:putative capsid protein [Pacific flying fox faeces associated circular DNA virus-8]